MLVVVLCGADAESTQRALETMNGFNLAGRQLRVARPMNTMLVCGSGGDSNGPPPSMVSGSESAGSLAQAAAAAHDVISFFQAQAQAQKFHLASIQRSG